MDMLDMCMDIEPKIETFVKSALIFYGKLQHAYKPVYVAVYTDL